MSTNPELFDYSEVQYRNGEAANANPHSLPVDTGYRVIRQVVKVSDDGAITPTQTTDYYLDGRMKSTSGDLSPALTSSYTVNSSGLEETSSYLDGANLRETTVTQYDHAGRVLSTTQSTNATSYLYGLAGAGSAAGKLIRMTDGDGVVTLYGYNSEGEPTTVAVNEDSATPIEIDFDGADRITVTETNPGVYDDGTNSHEVIITTTKVYATENDDSATTTKTVYQRTDGLGSWVEKLGVAQPQKTEIELAAGGDHIVTVTAANGAISRDYYDHGRKAASTFWQSGGSPPATPPADIQNVAVGLGFVSGKSYGYDTLGRLVTTTDSRTGTETTAYLSTTSDYVKSITDAGSRTTRVTYDHRGRRKAVDKPDTDAYDGATLQSNGNVTLASFFPNGKLQSKSGDQVYPTAYTYDYAERLSTLTTYGNTTATTSWLYDADFGRLVEKNYHGETDNPATAPASADYVYSNAGRLLTRRWERGVTTTYSYTHGLLTGVDYSDSTPDLIYSYERLGRVATVSRGGVPHAEYNYDSSTLALSEEELNKDLLPRTILRHRDSLMRPLSLEVASEYSSGYGYDLAGRLSQVWVQPTLDATTHVPQGNADFDYQYTSGSSGLVKSISGPAHSVENLWKSDRNLLDTRSNTAATGNVVVSSFQYTVNALGQRTKVVSPDDPTDPADNATYPVSWDWAYNKRGEIVEADHATAINDRAYQYDGIGNRQKALDGALVVDLAAASNNYVANALNQYSVANGITLPTAPAPNPYDEDGNYTSGPLPNDQIVDAAILTWNGENRLIKVTKKNGDIIDYVYDYLGRRVKKTITPNGGSPQSKFYLYDRWNLIVEYETAGTLANGDDLKTYTWGQDLSGSRQGAGGVGGLLTVTEYERDSGSWDHQGSYHSLFDGNGNVTEYLDSTGTPVAHYEYDPFGRTIASSGAKAAEFVHRFSTKYYDEETGFYYYGYRYYDPVTGRWPSRDPIQERGGINLYGFLWNDQVNFIDLLGNGPVFKLCKKLGWKGTKKKLKKELKEEILEEVAEEAAETGVEKATDKLDDLIEEAIEEFMPTNTPAEEAGSWLPGGWIYETVCLLRDATNKKNIKDTVKAALPTKGKGKKGKGRDKGDRMTDSDSTTDQLEGITDAQDKSKKNRPSILDDDNDWDGVKRRPKANDIYSKRKSEQRARNNNYDWEED